MAFLGIGAGPTAAMTAAGGAAAAQGQLGAQAGQQYGNYIAPANTAVNKYSTTLGYNAYTDPTTAGFLNARTSGMTGDTARAGTNLTANLAGRGIMGNSSMLTGGLAAIDAAAAGELAGARNDLANNEYTQTLANEGTNAGLLTGQRDTAFGQEEGANQDQFSDQMSLAQMQYQQQQAAQQALMGTVGAVAGLGGAAFGGTGGAMLGSLGGSLGGRQQPVTRGAQPATVNGATNGAYHPITAYVPPPTFEDPYAGAGASSSPWFQNQPTARYTPVTGPYG